ncbi:hypothetical protein DFQ26_005673 [Actinomortierella ambigua]|nr:hypothetical protein DFQ26_005673 [Actinomortierella ambigua]
MALESFGERALVFLRPRRSGKSLALSILAHFHGREHLPDYKSLFEGLAIDEDVKNNRVSPGQFFVLQFDFAALNRSQDKKVAEHSLNLMLNRSIKQFYKTYEPYLRVSADYLIKNFIKDDATASLGECADFVHNTLASVESPEDPLLRIKGIYLMADEYDSYTNDYLVPVDNSVHRKPPRGTHPDSLLKGFWASVKSGLGRGISKCYITGVTPQSLVDNTSGFNVARHVSWEPKLAGFCGLTEADVAAALALDKAGELARSKAAWLSYMVHFGGLTFCLGKKALRIPNLVVAERFGSAILHRHHANLEDVEDGLKALLERGSIDKILGLYARGMQQLDVGAQDFKKKEEDHCNSLRFTLLANVHPSLRKVDVETTMTKPSGTPGRIDMLVSVPLRKQLFVLEWKSIQIDYIRIGSGSQLQRANVLSEVPDATGVLDLKFRNDKLRAGQTIKEWILSGPKDGNGPSPQEQLCEYVQSPEIAKWEKDGYAITPVLVVVVGSRHILLWNLDGDRLDGSPRLCSE